MLKSPNVSDPKVLIGIAVFFLLIGQMVLDPLAGFIFFAIAGVVAMIAVLKGRNRLRYIAFLLLLIIVVITVLKFSEARSHFKAYKSKATIGNVK